MTTQLNLPARRWRASALVLSALLAALIFAWQLLPSPTSSGAFKALLLCIPLLLPLAGIARGHRYTYRWATLCVMPYFVVGTTEVIANPAARVWSALMLILALGLFSALIGFLRAEAQGPV
jgi:uncharacterized membrane protein